MNLLGFLFFLLISIKPGFAQSPIDTIKTKRLEEVVIKGQRLFDIERLPPVDGTYIWSGKKSEVISVQNIDANIAEKTPRQIFAKVPGVFVYDMDGSGNQVNISTRGLDPHRGWEFNIRCNGAITNSDVYGYPASHYSVPIEAVDRIELVRGTGALQYGAQFGGMLNYITKQPDTARTFAFESINSIGSFGLLSTYNAVSGKLGKFQYLVYYSKRVSNGYRDNGSTEYDAQSLVLIYTPSSRLKFVAELDRSNYVYQMPGPLTDSMFYAAPRQATRSRNYFNPEIWVPSFTMHWSLGPNTRISWKTSAVLGYRNGVMFDRPATVEDKIDPVTLTYESRQVDIDTFNSYNSELRFLHGYSLFSLASTVAGGIQYFKNDLHRRQLGKGTTGTDFDLTLIDPTWGRDLHFKTNNIAFFAENKFQFLPQLSITPGVRVELGESVMSGTISYYEPENIPNTIEHSFPLFGVNAQYQLKKGAMIYAGWSQAYRPVIFKDIISSSVYEKADKNLKDAYGYSLEAGFRGSTPSWRWDVSLFRLQYNNRLGSQAMYDENGTFYLYRTNIGNSVTDGVELFLEYGIHQGKNVNVAVFTLMRNEDLIITGQVQKHLFFIRSGVQMCHFERSDKIHVIAFTYSPNLCAIPDSFSEQIPSKYCFTCVTESVVDCLSFEDLQLIYSQFPNIETLFRRINDKLLAGLLNLHIEFRSMSIEERFTAFCQRSPHLLQKVPHKYIASYLGIDATNFSKLYNSIRI